MEAGTTPGYGHSVTSEWMTRYGRHELLAARARDEVTGDYYPGNVLNLDDPFSPCITSRRRGLSALPTTEGRWCLAVGMEERADCDGFVFLEDGDQSPSWETRILGTERLLPVAVSVELIEDMNRFYASERERRASVSRPGSHEQQNSSEVSDESIRRLSTRAFLEEPWNFEGRVEMELDLPQELEHLRPEVESFWAQRRIWEEADQQAPRGSARWAEVVHELTGPDAPRGARHEFHEASQEGSDAAAPGYVSFPRN